MQNRANNKDQQGSGNEIPEVGNVQGVKENMRQVMGSERRAMRNKNEAAKLKNRRTRNGIERQTANSSDQAVGSEL